MMHEILEQSQLAVRGVLDRLCIELGLDGIEELSLDEVKEELEERDMFYFVTTDKSNSNENSRIHIIIVNHKQERVVKHGIVQIKIMPDEIEIVGGSLTDEGVDHVNQMFNEWRVNNKK